MKYREYRLHCRWCQSDFGMIHNSDQERAANRLLNAHQNTAHPDELAAYHKQMRESD